MTAARKYDPWLPGAVRTEDGLAFEPTLLIHADEAFMLLPAVERFLAELDRMGASAKARRLEPLVARWRYLADFHRTRGSSACADESAAGMRLRPSSPSQHDDWITTGDAADLLGVTPTRVRQLLTAGELDGGKPGRFWLVSEASVRSYRGKAA